MDIRLLFPNQYISSADLRDRDVTLTISCVKVDDLRTDKGSERKPVVYFREMEARHRRGEGENKRLVLNKTNAKVIAKLYGHETNEWAGKRITLYPTTCMAFGQQVECIRVRETAPAAPRQQQRKPEPPPEPDPVDDGADPFGDEALGMPANA